jgi:hypothetical protein
VSTCSKLFEAILVSTQRNRVTIQRNCDFWPFLCIGTGFLCVVIENIAICDVSVSRLRNAKFGNLGHEHTKKLLCVCICIQLRNGLMELELVLQASQYSSTPVQVYSVLVVLQCNCSGSTTPVVRCWPVHHDGRETSIGVQSYLDISTKSALSILGQIRERIPIGGCHQLVQVEVVLTTC